MRIHCRSEGPNAALYSSWDISALDGFGCVLTMSSISSQPGQAKFSAGASLETWVLRRISAAVVEENVMIDCERFKNGGAEQA